jgi:hypothetical protein
MHLLYQIQIHLIYYIAKTGSGQNLMDECFSGAGAGLPRAREGNCSRWFLNAHNASHRQQHSRTHAIHALDDREEHAAA